MSDEKRKLTGAEKLEQWSEGRLNKYGFSINNSLIQLWGGTRSVGQDQVFTNEDGLSEHLTFNEMCEKAVELWHADKTPKHYYALVYQHDVMPTATDLGMFFRVNFSGPHMRGHEFYFMAEDEETALKLVRDCYPADNIPTQIRIWETNGDRT